MVAREIQELTCLPLLPFRSSQPGRHLYRAPGFLLVNGRNEQGEGNSCSAITHWKRCTSRGSVSHLRWGRWRMGSARCRKSWWAAPVSAREKSRDWISNLKLTITLFARWGARGSFAGIAYHRIPSSQEEGLREEGAPQRYGLYLLSSTPRA